MTTKTDITLPPLPMPIRGSAFVRGHAPDDDRLREWGRAAVEADRQRQSAVISDIWRVLHDAGAPDHVFDMSIIEAVRAMIGQPAASAEPDDMPLLDDRATYPASQVRRLIREDRARRAPVAQEPVEWVSKTIAYSKYISDARYRKLRPAAQRWYEPYKCASCAAPVAAQAQPSGNAGELPTELDDLKLAYVSACEERDHLRAALAAQPSAQDREDAERYAYLRDTPRSEWPESLRSAVDLQQNAILDREIDAARAAKGADHA